MIIFVHIPKTAGTTFRYILRNSFGLSHCDTTHTRRKLFDLGQLNAARKMFPGLKSIGGHNVIEPTR